VTAPIVISRVRFAAANAVEQATGLIGWISCVLNGAVLLDGLTLRRTRDGRSTISFPSRRDGGQRHFFVRPLDDSTRLLIESQLFSALGVKAGVTLP